VRTSAQRIAAYEARMQSTLLDPTNAAINDLAKANFATYANEFVPKQQQLRALLNALSIPTIQFGGYEAYNGEMYHLWKTTDGPAAVTTGAALVTKWTSLGLNAIALKAIAADLYNITIP